jgi:hypothetical protein
MKILSGRVPAVSSYTQSGIMAGLQETYLFLAIDPFPLVDEFHWATIMY